MKKITILAAVVALLGSCAQNTEDTIKPNTKAEGRTIYATFDNEEEGTKTYVENYKYLRWHAGDEISFFDATTYNSQYAFAGNDGDAEGEFNAVATGEGTAIATTYGVYPYNANTVISEEGVISVELPAIQAYGVNSFGKGANTMVAVGESATDDKLFFKNACGYLVVKLYNENGAVVKSVVLEGNNEEKIAGAATITATYAGIPSVTMTDTATTSITIDCGEGVSIGTTAETATEFWFVLPEITFEGGITITATDTEGKEYEKTTTKPVAITRNNVQPMKALGAFFMPHIIPETWKIYYTAITKTEKQSWSKTTFGANIVSNEWDSATGKGVITFDGVVTKIGNSAFDYCTSLTSITIPDSVTSIGYYAFSGCSNIASTTIGKGVISIGEWAFYGCGGELIINSPIIEQIFSGWSGGPNDENEDNYHWIDYSKFSSLIIGDNITKIGAAAFRGCSFKSVTIPSSITSIGDSAFENCANLTTVCVGGGAIGSSAFFECTKLESATLYNGVTSIGSYAFYGCSKLASVVIDDGVKSIERKAFYGCSSLTSLNIPNSVTSIGYAAFHSCSRLASITIPNSVTSIGAESFYGCTGKLTIDSKSLIETDYTYDNTPSRYTSGWLFGSKFSSVVVGETITKIGSNVFNGCSYLKNITLPNNIVSIGEYAFYNCSGISGWTIIPDKTTTIGDYAFYNCKSMPAVILGEGVKSIGNRAFWGCDNLKEIWCKPTMEPKIYYNANDNQGSFPFNADMAIYVPQEAYQYYTIWGGYVSGSITYANWYVYEPYLWKTNF